MRDASLEESLPDFAVVSNASQADLSRHRHRVCVGEAPEERSQHASDPNEEQALPSEAVELAGERVSHSHLCECRRCAPWEESRGTTTWLRVHSRRRLQSQPSRFLGTRTRLPLVAT